MPPEPSLLDLLQATLGTASAQRWLRWALAVFCALLGLWLMNGGDTAGGSGWLWLGFAVLAFLWSFFVKATPGAPLPPLTLEQVSKPESVIAGGTPAPLLVPPSPATFARPALNAAQVRLPLALGLAAVGQWVLSFSRDNYLWGLGFYAVALGVFAWTLVSDHLLGERHATAPAQPLALNPRWAWLGVAVFAGFLAFIGASDNQFRWWGVCAWVIAVVAWVGALWEGDVTLNVSGLAERLHAWWAAHWGEGRLTLNVALSRTVLLFGLIFAVGAYFRFAQLDAIPVEMTSDHVEKLFDVNDLLHGQHPVFFIRNTGREPLQFYFAELVDWVLHTGVTHLTLKITGAVAGVLLLPTMYFLGRELEDERFGLLAMALTAISFWATAISRVGLRFPLHPVFAAPIMLFCLRGLRRGAANAHNDFLLAGLFLGAGLYGYSPIRVMPVVIVAMAAWFALTSPEWGDWRARGLRVLHALAVVFGTAFVVFLPLYRYATEPNNGFWYRSLTRLSGQEQALPADLARTFLENQWNVLRMFNWKGDEVWVNTLPGAPVLDWVTGALLLLGVGYLLTRLFLRFDKVAGFLLLIVPVLLLPSSLALAFPNENPSVVRAGGAIPIIFLIAAYPLWLVLKLFGRLALTRPQRTGYWLVGGALVVAAWFNYQMYFVQYPAQYLGPAQNASEIGAVVRDFAHSIGTYDDAWICLHPYWADTRAVGIYAGQVGWENVLPPTEFVTLQQNPRNLLVIVNKDGTECQNTLRNLFPTGRFKLMHSARGASKDFLVFFVPGVVDEASPP